MPTVKAFRTESKNSYFETKWFLFRWNFKSFELLFMYIHHSLASLSVLFKHKSLIFVNLNLFLHCVSIFWLGRLNILLKLQRPALNMHVIWSKTGIYIWNLSEKSVVDVWRFITNSTSLQFQVYRPLFYTKEHEKLLQVANPLQSYLS